MILSSLGEFRRPRSVVRKGILLLGAALFFLLPFLSLELNFAALVLFPLCSLFLGALGGWAPGFLSLGILFPIFWYFFLPSLGSPAVSERLLLVLFLLAGIVAVLVPSWFRTRLLSTEKEMAWTRLMCRLIRGITGAQGPQAVLAAAQLAVEELLPDHISFFLFRDEELLELQGRELVPSPTGEEGPGGGGISLPLAVEGQSFGLMKVRYADPRDYTSGEKRELLEAVALQVAAALEREEQAMWGHQENLEAEGEKLRSSLLRSLSHDFRTPLAGIAGTAEYLLENSSEMASSQDRELLSNIHEEAAWLSRVLDNILGLTRFDSAAVVLRKEAEPVEEVVGSALAILSLRLTDFPIELRLPDSVLMVPMESGLIEQVLINLLDNAMKYSSGGSPIQLVVKAESNRAVFEVADRGRGFPPGDQDRIFEKFDRGGGPQTRGVRGTGLGLSICKAIVEAHGGQIKALPRDGGGARFIFTLPLEVASDGK